MILTSSKRHRCEEIVWRDGNKLAVIRVDRNVQQRKSNLRRDIINFNCKKKQPEALVSTLPGIDIQVNGQLPVCK